MKTNGRALFIDSARGIAMILVLVAHSFNASRYSAGWTGFTLHWYARLLERADILRALRLSLVVAGTITVIATALGTLVALALARRAFRGQRLLEGGLYLPIVTPEFVAGISLLILFAAEEILNNIFSQFCIGK